MKELCKIGEVYGQLTIIERDLSRSDNKIYWICECNCHRGLASYAQTSLRNGRASRCKKCGYEKASQSRLGKIYEEMIGKRFGYLTVLERDITKPSGMGYHTYWKCRCDCGNIVSIDTATLNNGRQTCGLECPIRGNLISLSKTEDLIGKQFGDLIVLARDKEEEQKHTNRNTYWKCKCKCGTEETISRNSLINEHRKCCYKCLKGKSLGEKNIEDILRKNNIIFQKEISFSDLKGINNGFCRFDFGIYKNNALIRLIEFDGELHYTNIEIWNSNSVKENNIIKNQYAKEHNIPLIRIPYWERNSITLEMLLGDKYLI